MVRALRQAKLADGVVFVSMSELTFPAPQVVFSGEVRLIPPNSTATSGFYLCSNATDTLTATNISELSKKGSTVWRHNSPYSVDPTMWLYG